jgi:hypothetical protein
MDAIVTLALLALFALYVLPSAIALHRHHPRTGAVLLWNLVLTWSVVGWFVALGIASSPTETKANDRDTTDAGPDSPGR